MSVNFYPIYEMSKLNIKPKGEKCPEPESQKCFEAHCPVDCVSEWAEWSNCSEPCGFGSRTRELNITTEAAHNGIECPKIQTETEPCKIEACPVNCIHEWSDWSACSATCGNGTQTRRVKDITANPEGLGEIQVSVDNSTDANATIRLRLYEMSAGNNTESLWNCSTGWLLSFLFSNNNNHLIQ